MHNAQNARNIAGALTILIELASGVVGGYTAYEVFYLLNWLLGWAVGLLFFAIMFLAGLYVFIYREYGVDAIKLFSKMRDEIGKYRMFCSWVAVGVVLGIETGLLWFRMYELPLANSAAKYAVWVAFQLVVFLPFFIAPVVHAHVNVASKKPDANAKFTEQMNRDTMQEVQKIWPKLSGHEKLQVRNGDYSPITRRLAPVEQEERTTDDPLDDILAGLGKAMSNGHKGQDQKQPS